MEQLTLAVITSGQIVLGTGAIVGTGTVVALTAGQFVYGTGSISGTANLQALGGFTVSAQGSIIGSATVTASKHSYLVR